MIKRRLVRLACKAGCLLCLLAFVMFYGAAAEGKGLDWPGAAVLCVACLLLCKVLYRRSKVSRISRAKCDMIKLPENKGRGFRPKDGRRWVGHGVCLPPSSRPG